MSAIRRSIVKFAHAFVKLLPPTPPKSAKRDSNTAGTKRTHAAISSPWRIYRIYARPGHLLIRNEQGQVLDLGVMKGQTPNLTYRLFIRDLSGRGFANRTELLDDVARRIEAGEVGDELLTLPDWEKTPGADLDRGTHVDVSMRTQR
ncbi:hypothetical protein [Achromobacter arsenitoxydans]|uniref:hypothetical protein n=1 Tax=Achromobacter arsenitoxydans TaxID=1147684 RepID=UPI0009DA2016|nr:hypothetical protein [Achromobacter arsenitoxydans]